jgi:hypothetical protein
LSTITSSDVGGRSWLNELDKQYGPDRRQLAWSSFIDDLKKGLHR